MRKIREVLRLKAEARLSDRQIAEAIGSARSTVQACLRRAKAANPELAHAVNDGPDSKLRDSLAWNLALLRDLVKRESN